MIINRGRLKARMGLGLGVALGLGLGVSSVAHGASLCSTGFCADECWQLGRKGWTIGSSVEGATEDASTVSASAGTSTASNVNVSKVYKRQICAAGRVRIRRINNKGTMSVTCADLEGCSGAAGTTVRICTQKNPSTDVSYVGAMQYVCAVCTAGKTVKGDGSCGT
jgi:hypothetical protein